MIGESLLAALHLLAILAAVVFLSSATALCRVEFMGPAVMDRLWQVYRIYLGAMAAAWVTGGLRLLLGAKGWAWYAANPLMWIKLSVMLGVTLWSVRVWRTRSGWSPCSDFPTQTAVSELRATLMRIAHVMIVAPMLAVFIARGFGA